MFYERAMLEHFARLRIMKVRAEDDFSCKKQCHTFQNALQIPCLITHFSYGFQFWKEKVKITYVVYLLVILIEVKIQALCGDIFPPETCKRS